MSETHLALAVDALLDELFDSGVELGLQVAVIRHGHTLVDAARGVVDPRSGALVDSDTLCWAGSTAKGVATTVAHVLVSEGTMSARGVARMYSALLGHVDGVTLVSAPRLAAMAAVSFIGMDEVMGFASSWAFGYSPSRPNGRSKPGSTFGMIGMNGSAAYADIESGVAVAVMRNRFTAGDFTTVARIDQLIADELS